MDYDGLYYPLLSRRFIFVWRLFCWLLLCRNRDQSAYKRKRIRKKKMGGVLIAAILETFLTRGAVCTVELVVASVLLLLCLCKKMPFLGCGICAWVGKISYSLYLIHQNVGFWIEYQLIHENDLYKMQYAFIAIVIVFLLAILLFYMVEKPSRKIIEDSKRRKNAVIC